MHPLIHAQNHPDKPAFIMAGSGLAVSYAELNENSQRCAQLLRSLGLKTGDTIAICMDNNPAYFELCWAAQRSGLYFTCVSNKLSAPEVLYIIEDSKARAVFLSPSQAAVAAGVREGVGDGVHLFAANGSIEGYPGYEEARDRCPAEDVPDATSGTDMLYSSGTTGRPKGIRVALPDTPIEECNPLLLKLGMFYGLNENSVYLTPAPLYHAAPLRYSMLVQRLGGTVVVMEHFDPEQALALIEKYRITESQWVPTMFVRMLKLDPAVRTRFDLSSHRCAIHAAAPCPKEIKKELIEWWGPIVEEYYAGSEGNGATVINSADWLNNEGSVGRILFGEIHICDDDGNEVPTGQEGTIYFSGGTEFEYYNDPEKTAGSRHPTQPGWSTLGDVGYVNEEGFLWLTDRKANMIISGGVNIYPQETENLLVTHPKVMDVAVFGVPDPDFGEQVKAVVQPIDMADAGPDLEIELIEFCREQLSHIKCPKSVDFQAELPRHPNGKLFKRLLRDKYWTGRESRIV